MVLPLYLPPRARSALIPLPISTKREPEKQETDRKKHLSENVRKVIGSEPNVSESAPDWSPSAAWYPSGHRRSRAHESHSLLQRSSFSLESPPTSGAECACCCYSICHGMDILLLFDMEWTFCC